MGEQNTHDHIKINIRMKTPNQEPSASSKTPNQDLQDMDVLCTLKIKIESWNLDHRCIKDQWRYPNQDQVAKLWSGTSRILKSPKSGLKGFECSLHLQNQNREPKFRNWVSKTSDHIKINIRMPNPNQEPPASSKAPNQDLKDMDVLCTFKIKIESQNSEYNCTKD